PDRQFTLFAGTVCWRQYSGHDSSARRSAILAGFEWDALAAIYAVYQLGTVMFCSPSRAVPSGLSASGHQTGVNFRLFTVTGHCIADHGESEYFDTFWTEF